MTKPDHCEGGRVAKPMSRREKKIARKGLGPVGVRNDVDAALRNSRARRLHQILRRPGRGGLTATGAEQLQQYFSRKAKDAEKLSLREMDESAVMIVLQMAAEEVDAEGLSYGELRQVAEETVIVNRAEVGPGREKEEKEKGEGENVGTEVFKEAKASPILQWEHKLGEEGLEGGGVALANDFNLCMRPKKQGGARLDPAL